MIGDRLGRFLNGDADDEEFKRCETWLEDAQTIVDEAAVDSSDPLIASLRAAGAVATDEDDSSRQLVKRIGGVVAQQVISREEMERLLDAPQQPDELGRIGRYRVIEFMAAGGMGLVFKAEDSHLNRLVCIKIMHPALALKSDARLRFERESRSAAQLRSERIVTLLDIGVQRELPYIVMQLLDGESLRSKLSREGKLSAQQSVHYMMQIAEGLRHAHGMGLLHRDIKPDNIWITSTGELKLLDFGLARPFEDTGNLTTTGGLIGTPQYMSPEQIQGQSLDARSDLFSLGVVLFEMLTGILPFQKNNLFSTMVAITNDSVSLPALDSNNEIDLDVENILQRLLKKNPDERIQSAQELMDLLSRIGSLPTEAFAKTHRATTATERTAPIVRASRGHSNRLRYVLAGVAGGLSAMLLLILVMQATDKGTLLVRSDDPQVEIRIAQEKVHVKDPLSGKSFEIQIGKTRLPGGVYQLELKDASAGLAFSSNTIAIRRGETVVVEVELQRTDQVAANAESNPLAERGSPPTSAANDTEAALKNADPSFQLKAREDFARILDSLPAQSIDSADRPVDSQRPLNAAENIWSIDTDTFSDRGARYNCDRSLLATVRENTVQIWDTSLKLKFTLRSSHTIGQARFDNKYPNLIATSSFVQTQGKGDQPDEWKGELTVWRLGAGYVEIIYRMPCVGYQFAWDQGYRLFYEGRDGLMAFRLDEKKNYELHVPAGAMLVNAISTNGRYLAKHNGPNVDVWDLHRGEFAFASLNNWQVNWNQQGDRAAFLSSNRNAFEIWDLEKRAIDDRVELPSEPERTQTEMQSSVIGLEPTFQRVAWLSPQGKLSVRNLRNNREDSQFLPNSGKAPINKASVQWEGSSLIVETDQAAFVWTHDKSDVEGTLKERKPSALLVKKRGIPLEFTHVVGSDRPVLLWHDEVANKSNGNKSAMTIDPRERKPELYFDAFDTSANKLVHETPFSQMRATVFSNAFGVGGANSPGPPYISFDGRYATSSSVNRGREETSLVKFVDADSLEKLELPSESAGAATFWDKSSRFAYFADIRSSSGPRPLQIFDTQVARFVDLQNLTLPTGKVIEIGRSQQGYVVVTRLPSSVAGPKVPGQRTIPPKYSGEREVWRVDPQVPNVSKAEAATKLLAKLGTVESIAATDRYLFVSLFVSQENVEKPTTVRKYYRIALDGELASNVQCVTVPEVDELYLASSGEHVVRVARDAEVIGETNSELIGRRLQISTKGPTKLYDAQWSDIAKDLGDLDAFEKPSPMDDDWSTLTEFKHCLSVVHVNQYPTIQWHPKHDVVAWISNGYANFFGAKDNDLRRIAAWTGGPLLASDKGWVRADHHEVQFFEISGKPIGKLMFDPYLEEMKPSRPRWKLADGSMAEECGSAGLAISYLHGDRLYCRSVEEFERALDQKLPRASVVSRLKASP